MKKQINNDNFKAFKVKRKYLRAWFGGEKNKILEKRNIRNCYLQCF